MLAKDILRGINEMDGPRLVGEQVDTLTKECWEFVYMPTLMKKYPNKEIPAPLKDLEEYVALRDVAMKYKMDLRTFLQRYGFTVVEST